MLQLAFPGGKLVESTPAWFAVRRKEHTYQSHKSHHNPAPSHQNNTKIETINMDLTTIQHKKLLNLNTGFSADDPKSMEHSANGLSCGRTDNNLDPLVLPTYHTVTTFCSTLADNEDYDNVSHCWSETEISLTFLYVEDLFKPDPLLDSTENSPIVLGSRTSSRPLVQKRHWRDYLSFLPLMIASLACRDSKIHKIPYIWITRSPATTDSMKEWVAKDHGTPPIRLRALTTPCKT